MAFRRRQERLHLRFEDVIDQDPRWRIGQSDRSQTAASDPARREEKLGPHEHKRKRDRDHAIVPAPACARGRNDAHPGEQQLAYRSARKQEPLGWIAAQPKIEEVVPHGGAERTADASQSVGRTEKTDFSAPNASNTSGSVSNDHDGFPEWRI